MAQTDSYYLTRQVTKKRNEKAAWQGKRGGCQPVTYSGSQLSMNFCAWHGALRTAQYQARSRTISEDCLGVAV